MNSRFAVLVSCFCLLSVLVYAQPTKGDVSLGGNVVAAYTNQRTPFLPVNTDVEILSAQITPRVGLFLTDHLSVGANVSYQFARANFNLGYSNNRFISIAPQVAYYFGEGPWQPYLLGAVGYRNEFFELRETPASGDRLVENYLFYEAEAGVAYWFAPNVSAVAFLNYNGDELQSESFPETVRSLNLGIGVRYIWAR